MIGDYESVTAMITVLADPANNTGTPYGCSVKNLGPYSLNTASDNGTLPVKFQNVIQWYRSSSFALAYAGYNNSYAVAPLNETGTLGWNDTAPLPTQQVNSAFLRCINNTITAALPILDAEDNKKKLSPGAIAGIVIGSVVGAFALIGLAAFLWLRYIQKKYGKKDKKDKKDKKTKHHSKLTSSDSEPKNTSAAGLVEDSAAGGGWVGGFFNKKKGPNPDAEADIDGKKGPVAEEKGKKKGPADEHKDKSNSHRDAESDESPNAGVAFPEPKAY
jgi:hypothetical protein